MDVNGLIFVPAINSLYVLNKCYIVQYRFWNWWWNITFNCDIKVWVLNYLAWRVKLNPQLYFHHVSVILTKDKTENSLQLFSSKSEKNKNCCDVCAVSHISTCKHFSIPRGATNPKPNHSISGACEKASLFGFVYSSQKVAIHQNNSYNSPSSVAGQTSLHRQVCWQAEVVPGTFKFLKIPQWVRKEQIIIHIPQSLLLHTQRTSCYLNTLQ